MQAQDFRAALWAIGRRLPACTESDIRRAIAEARIVRTWPMRGTLHFIAGEDLGWMLRLLGPGILSRSAGRRRQLELDEKTLMTAGRLLERALTKEGPLTRRALFSLLEKRKIVASGQRGIHILQYHALHGLICLASHQGKQPAFALTETWIREEKKLTESEALSELTLRYFRSHGPATAADFAWWSGLGITQVKKGIALCAGQLENREVKDAEYWTAPASAGRVPAAPRLIMLAGFDEYILGYRNRELMLDPADAPHIAPGNNGMFLPMLVSQGRIRGTWRAPVRHGVLTPEFLPFAGSEMLPSGLLKREKERYRAFWDADTGS